MGWFKGKEGDDAIERGDAQVEDRQLTLGEQVGTGGEVPEAGSGDQNIGGEEGKEAGSPPPSDAPVGETMIVTGGVIGRLTNGKTLPVGPFPLEKTDQDRLVEELHDYNALRVGLHLAPVSLVWNGELTECGKFKDAGWYLTESLPAEEGEAD